MLSQKMVAEFVKRLPRGKARIYLEPDLWNAFFEALPHMKAAPGQREILSYLVDQLCLQGFERPRDKRRVDRTALPVLPLWLCMPRGDKNTVSKEVYIYRSEELAFLNDSRSRIRDDRWKRIDEWFLSGKASALLIPMRERSLEMFGDEKGLDGMTKSPFFRKGNISLETLRCFHVPEPIPYSIQTDSRSRACLVIENATTYFTFRKWNEVSGEYRAIAYGGGNAFSCSWEGLTELKGQVEEIEYFGDIDGEGLRIPWAVSKSIKQTGFPFRLSSRFYQMLLELGTDNRLPGANRHQPNKTMTEWVTAQLGLELAGRIIRVIEDSRRIPQEHCTLERLQKIAHSV